MLIGLYLSRLMRTTFLWLKYDDIVFGATTDTRAIEFSKEMKKEFEMSMVRELTFFLGLQVKQKKEVIFISQEKYGRNFVKMFGLDSKKHASTPLSSSTKLNLDTSEVEVSPILYRSIIRCSTVCPRLSLIWLKMISGNHFTPAYVFGKHRKLGQTEINFRVDYKIPLLSWK